MFGFFVLLSFSESLAHVADQTKCVSLNNELFVVRLTLTDLKPAELKYYSFMVILGKCSETCNSGIILPSKICVPSRTNANANTILQQVIPLKNGIIKRVKWNVNIIECEKNILAQILAHALVRIARF